MTKSSLWAITGLGMIVVALFGPWPARAQEACVNVEQDMAAAIAHGFKWLGVYAPPEGVSSDGAIAFYSKDGLVYMSPVIDGCVHQKAWVMGRDTSEAPPLERPAVRGTPA